MSDIDWGGKPVPVTRLCGWDWVPLDIAQARIAALEAALTAERERADRAEAERDALQAEVELWKERAYQLSHA